jgi:hypothetical protein
MSASMRIISAGNAGCLTRKVFVADQGMTEDGGGGDIRKSYVIRYDILLYILHPTYSWIIQDSCYSRET